MANTLDAPRQKSPPAPRQQQQHYPTDDDTFEVAEPVRCGPVFNVRVADLTRFAPDRATAKQSIVEEITRQTAARRAARNRDCGVPACAAGTCGEVILSVMVEVAPRKFKDVALEEALEEKEATYRDAAGALVAGVRLYFTGGVVKTACQCGQIA